MQPIDESIVFAAIRQCLETADHYIRQGNRRDAEFYLDRANAYADRIIFCRQMAGDDPKSESWRMRGASP
jgi:hypothetical protein